VLATSSKGTSTKPGVLDEEKVTSKANVILEWGSEQESEYSEEEDNDDDDDEMIEWVDMDEEEEKKDDDDDKSIDLEQTGDEETDDEFVHGEEHVQDDDEETDDEMYTVMKICDQGDAVKTEEVRMNSKKANIFNKLQLSAKSGKISKGYVRAVINEPLAEALATLKSQVPTILPSQARFRHQQAEKQESKKSALEIRKIKKEQAKKQKMSKYTIKSTDKATLKEYDLKKALSQTMKENKSFNKNTANHALYHALMEALIEDGNTMDKGVANIVKNHKR
ncbi:hypothetical protein Tco_1350308, partial [Tanacetum coccineum]